MLLPQLAQGLTGTRAVLEAVTGRGLLFTAPLGEAGPQRLSDSVGKCLPIFMARVGPGPSSEASLASARPTRDALDRLRGGTGRGRGRECGGRGERGRLAVGAV